MKQTEQLPTLERNEILLRKHRLRQKKCHAVGYDNLNLIKSL